MPTALSWLWVNVPMFGHSRTKSFAAVEGWDLEDLVASQAYGSFQKRKNFLLEPVEAEGK